MRAATTILLGLTLVATPVLAQPTPPPDTSGDPDQVIANLRETILYARYRNALPLAEALLARADLLARQRNVVLELLATAQIATRDQPGAARTLTTLFSRDPAHRLSDAEASPTVQSAFARARSAATTPVDVSIERVSPARAETRDSPEVVVRITSSADAVDEVRLSYRQAGDSRFSRVVMELERDGTAHARLPSPAGRESAQISFYVEALAPSLTPLSALGTAAEPLSIDIPAAPSLEPIQAPPPRRPPPFFDATSNAGAHDGTDSRDDGGSSVFAKWWFWTIIGAALVAGAVTTYILIGPPSEQPTGSLGFVQLEPPP